jgi:ankyrin repeat protein
MAVVAYNIVCRTTIMSCRGHDDFEVIIFCLSDHLLLISDGYVIDFNINGITPLIFASMVHKLWHN